MDRTRLRVGIAAALAVAAIAAPAVALACTEPAGGHRQFSVAERTRMAEVVLVGHVLSTTERGSWNDYSATVRVSESIKGGPLPDIVTISGFGSGALCRNGVVAGQGLMFFAVRLPNEALTLRYFSAGDAIAMPSEANVAAARAAALGTFEPPTVAPTSTAPARATTPTPMHRLWVPFASSPQHPVTGHASDIRQR